MKKILLVPIVVFTALFSGLFTFTVLNTTIEDKTSIDYVGVVENAKDCVVTKCAKELSKFVDICYAHYTGAVGDSTVTASMFGVNCESALRHRVERCIAYVMETDYSMIKQLKRCAKADVGNLLKCVNNPIVSSSIRVKHNLAVDEVIQNYEFQSQLFKRAADLLELKIERSEACKASDGAGKVIEGLKDAKKTLKKESESVLGNIASAAIKSLF